MNKHQQNIERLRSDPVTFLEAVYLDQFGQPIKLKEYQKQVIRKLGKKVAVKLGGK